MTEEEGRKAVVIEATTWLGTPYHHAARLKGIGVDCAMLLAEVYHNAGLIPEITPEDYPPDWHLHRDTERYLKWVEKFARKIETDCPLPGDIAMFRFGRATAHAGIVNAWPEIIHSYINCGVIPQNATDAWLWERFAGFYRYKDWL